MEYRNLGRSGVLVSPLCVGTMSWGASTEQDEAQRITDTALEHGLNFFDTANVYTEGRSESMLGRCLAGGKRDQVVLATKFSASTGAGVNDRGGSRRHIMMACEDSLRRLNTDWIDLYYVHFMDLETPLDETLQALDDLVRQGKVRYLGTSKWAASLITEANMLADRYGRARIIAEQPPYNLLERSIEKELVWAALRHGVGLVPWAPLATSILTGKYSSVDDRPAGSRHGEGKGLPPTRMTPAALERANALKPLAAERGVSLAQYALAWVAQQPAVAAPILGISKLEYLMSGLEAMQIKLTDDELERIDEIAPPGSAVSIYWDANTFQRLRKSILKDRR